MPPSGTSRSRTSSCRTCHLRQLPCDGEKPTCRQCRSARRPCTQRFNVRFSKRRAWNPTSIPVSTPFPLVAPQGDNLPSLEHETDGPATEETEIDEQSAHVEPIDEQIGGYQPSTHGSAENSLQDQDTLSPCVTTSTRSPDQRTPGSVGQFSPSIPPLLSSYEACLLQYFSTTLGGPWLDLTDPDFTTEVLALAPKCPALYFSVLALSSFHFSQQTGENGGKDEIYHQQAIAILLTLMRDPSLLEDGAGLASVVILRLYEESKARQDGLDTESHLLAGHVFSATITDGKQKSWNRLALAAFWVHQRQDVFHAVTHQKPTRTSLSQHFPVHPISSTDVYGWAKRSQLITGEVADFCFGSDEVAVAQRALQYDDMQLRLSAWSEQTWPLFQPILYLERDLASDRILPEIRFALNGCLTGFVHYKLSQLLLAMYNPKSLTLGPRAVDQHKSMEIEVQNHIRALCGTARHNKCPVGRAVACLSITLGAGWIHDPAERLELLDLLRLSERESGWSNLVNERQLRQVWDLAQ